MNQLQIPPSGDIGILYSMSIGTLAGYERAGGAA